MSSDLISDPNGVSRISLNERIKFIGHGINFKTYEQDNQQIILAEPIPPELSPTQRRSRLLKLNLQQIRNSDGAITLNGQVAARIRNLILKNPRGQLKQIIADRGHFTIGTLLSSGIRTRALGDILTPGIYSLSVPSDGSDPLSSSEMTTSIAISSDEQTCTQGELIAGGSDWYSEDNWQISYLINDACPDFSYDLYLLAGGSFQFLTSTDGCEEHCVTNSKVSLITFEHQGSAITTIPSTALDTTFLVLFAGDVQVDPDRKKINWTVHH